MSKHVLKRGTFKIDVYNWTMHIYVCSNCEVMVEACNKIIKKFKEEIVTYPCHALSFCPDLKPTVCYLFLSQDNLTINTITHETDHLRNYVMDFLSISENNDSKEASANLNGYINEKVFKFLTNNNFEILY